MSIGEKIKERRTALGLTQQALSGERMTRNMLSEIENGSASPSLPTLLYLAERLQVSPGYLLDDSMTLFEDNKRRCINTMYELFREKKYAACLATAKKYVGDETDTELSYLLCCACLAEAENCAAGGSVHTALSLLDKMEEYAALTDYDTAHLMARATLCRALASDPLTPFYALDEKAYLAYCATSGNDELYHYLRDDRDYTYQCTAYRTHMEARKLMKEYRYLDAIPLLTSLIDNRFSEQTSVLIIYRVYADLEACYRERKDYENAYKCAGKKHTLLASFRN